MCSRSRHILGFEGKSDFFEKGQNKTENGENCTKMCIRDRVEILLLVLSKLINFYPPPP